MIGIGRGTRKLRLALFLALVGIGCSTAKDASGPVVLETKGHRLGREEVRWTYDHQNSVGAFDAATPEQRSEFLTTIGDKEILLALAREHSPDLAPIPAIQLRETNETALLKALEHKVITPIQHDSIAAYYLERFHRQVHLMIFITPSDSLAKLAHAEVLAGAPFADVVMKRCKDPQVLERKGDIGWKTPETFGREFAMELWIEDRAPGYVTEVRRTPGGVIFYQVLGIRDPDSPLIPEREKLLTQLAPLIRAYNGMMAHIDSLRHASGFEIVGDNVPVLMKGMNAYWDSLAAWSRTASETPKTFTPPLSKFNAEERALPLYRLHNRTTTIGDFIKGMSEFSPKRWPMGPDMDAARKAIDARVVWTLQLDEARSLGFDRSEDYVMTARQEEEKLRIGDYVASGVAKDITVAPEAMRDYYDKNQSRYQTKELIQFSYVLFPDKGEAARFQQEASKQDLNWWGDQLAEFKKNRRDLIVTLNSPQYDPSKDVPDTVRVAVKAAWNSRVSDVTTPQPTVGGRWIVARTTYRSHAGVLPYEKVVNSIESTLKDQELNSRIDKLVKEGKVRFGLKLHPERLEKKG